ncbi:MAG: ribbon-helix-helix domain-containing protein [Thermodesulfobacteriota bacterium]|nr:ribbon-helix-helix domain-containing protein [Thermodesulfobacteriota bacterium]
MATSVKTAISMREELFEEVDKLAEELHVSRSKLFVMAVQEYIKKYESKKLLSQINDAFSDHPDSEENAIQGKMRQKHAKMSERDPW